MKQYSFSPADKRKRALPGWPVLCSAILFGLLVCGLYFLLQSALMESAWEKNDVPETDTAFFSGNDAAPPLAQAAAPIAERPVADAAPAALPALAQPDDPADEDIDARYSWIAYCLLRYQLDLQIRRILNKADEITGLPGYDPAWDPLVARLAFEGFDKGEMRRLFARLGPASYSPAFMAAKVAELHGPTGIGLASGDAAALLPEGYAAPLADASVASCLAFMREHATTLQKVEERYGVAPQIVMGILLVETGCGLDLGAAPAFRALASMAATDTPETLGGSGNSRQVQRINPHALASTLKDKSNWAYNELKALIVYGETCGSDACSIPGSIYGAIGLCQFMPSNIAPYGVDGDEDGRIDLFSVPDAMHSVGSYLEAHGWRSARNTDEQHRVLLFYNRDSAYASSVLGTAKRLSLALQGKVSPKADAVVYTGRVPSARLDPSLRRARPVPRSARVQDLGDYQKILE